MDQSNNDAATVRHFDSPIFGSIRDATPAEAELIARLAAECPAALFGAVNKRMNARGYCISTALLPAA